MKQPNELLMTQEGEAIKVELKTGLMRRPFPLFWGLLAIGLMLIFAGVTYYNIQRLNDENLYETNHRAWELSVKAHEDCVTSIQVRETYRDIFGGIEVMFRRTGELPASLFPTSTNAQRYRDEMEKNINEYITQPVSEGLPVRTLADCPVVEPEPERP